MNEESYSTNVNVLMYGREFRQLPGSNQPHMGLVLWFLFQEPLLSVPSGERAGQRCSLGWAIDMPHWMTGKPQVSLACSGWGLSNQNLHGWVVSNAYFSRPFGLLKAHADALGWVNSGKLVSGKPDFFSRAQKTAVGLAQDRPDYLYFRLYKEPGSPAVQIKVVLHSSTKILIQFRQLAAQWIQWLVASLDCSKLFLAVDGKHQELKIRYHNLAQPWVQFSNDI